MLVKELQLLKSVEGVRGGRGLYNEENEELPRRPSRQSRRHSRLDEEGEEEVVISKKIMRNLLLFLIARRKVGRVRQALRGRRRRWEGCALSPSSSS